MANLMGVTNPVPVYDSVTNRVQSPQDKPTDPNISNVVDTSKVIRADGKTEQQGANNNLNSNILKFDSNLQAFFSELQNAPDVAEELTKAILYMKDVVSTPGINEGVASEVNEFLKFIEMDEGKLAEFFKGQMGTSNRFEGALFDLLRQAYSKMQNNGIRDNILNFMKKYSDFSSGKHIEGNMLSRLKQISDYIPKSYADRLLNLVGTLEEAMRDGNKPDALKIVQRNILPFLANYVEKSHDMGKSRTLLSMFMLDVARYENGNVDGMLSNLRQLGAYGDMLSPLANINENALLTILNSGKYQQAVVTDTFAEKFALMTSRALNGHLGMEGRETFLELMRSILINESVYMPLKHFMLPMNFNGNLNYSEFWVDPDAEGDKKSDDSIDKKIQFLFKMDIASLGFLEMTIASYKDGVDLQVFAPEGLSDNKKIVIEDIKDILARNGVKPKHVDVEELIEPKALTDVFPNLFEGKSSINVTI